MRTILNLFGCSHKHMTRVFTLGRGFERRTYRVCTDCGKEFGYDFDAMRIVQEVKKAPIIQKKRQAQVVDIGEVRRIAR